MSARTIAFVSLVAAMLLGASPALADLPAQVADKAERENKSLRSAQDNLNRHCSTNIASEIDWASFAKPIVSGDRRSPFGFCKEAFSAIRSLCSDDESKQILENGIKRFTCTYGGGGKQTISLKKGHLVFAVDWETSNISDYVKRYLRTAKELVSDGFTLRMKQKIRAENKQLGNSLESMNRNCGLNISAQIEWKSFNKNLEKSDKDFRRNAAGICQEAIVAIRSLCDRSAYKKAMRKKLTKVSCRFTNSKKSTMKLKRGSFVLGISWKASNYSSRIVEYLKKAL